MGFILFMFVVVVGVLLLVGGLQRLGGPRGSGDVDRVSSPNVDRLETAISMLEARVDDLQEQQRFLERLLTQRPAPPSLPGPAESPGPTERDAPTGSILLDPELREGEGEGESER